MHNRPGRPPGLTPNGPEIYRLRVEVLGISTRELGARIGYAPASIRYAQKGRPISDIFVSRLASALGVHMRDISDWAGDDIKSDAEPKVPAA